MNPRAAINDLLPFQGSPFDLLGISPKALPNELYVQGNIRKRRGWDSNPCAPKDKRFSRPPRYDHFDTSPCFFLALISARHILPSMVVSVNRFFHFFVFYFSAEFESRIKPRIRGVHSICRCRNILATSRSSGVVILILVYLPSIRRTLCPVICSTIIASSVIVIVSAPARICPNRRS